MITSRNSFEHYVLLGFVFFAIFQFYFLEERVMSLSSESE